MRAGLAKILGRKVATDATTARKIFGVEADIETITER